jgi:hypothetical protein
LSRDYKMARSEQALAMHKFVSMHLSAIAEFLPDHCMTLILRCPENPAADAIIGDDQDFEAVIESLQACAGTFRAGDQDLH